MSNTPTLQPSPQPYAWLGAAGLYRTRMDGVTNGEQLLTPLYLHPTSQAAADVLAERRRQIEQEQWCPEHDDQYTRGELATAAAAYATSSHWHAIGHKSGIPPARWPWDESGWKPTTPRRDLVKAGALILAEIERLDRMERSQQNDLQNLADRRADALAGLLQQQPSAAQESTR